jgi:hypothetical protein
LLKTKSTASLATRAAPTKATVRDKKS